MSYLHSINAGDIEAIFEKFHHKNYNFLVR